MKYLYNPVGFDPTLYLPVRLHKFSESARYLLHAIENQRVFYKRSRNEYNPLKLVYLRNIMGQHGVADDIKDCFLKKNVIECDNYYAVGSKCFGYRLGQQLRDCIYERIECSTMLQKKIAYHTAPENHRLPVHQHLEYWLNEVDIVIDANAGIDANKLTDWNTAITMIVNRDFWLHCCDYNRVHTNISSLSKQLRKCLRIHGLELKCIDIRNSQPFFLASIVKTVLKQDSLISYFSKKKTEKRGEKHSHYDVSTIPYDFQSFSNTSDDRALPEDALDYIRLVESGLLYEEVMQLSGETDREEAKKLFFSSILFGKDYPNAIRNAFRDRFPSVYAVVNYLKKEDYRHCSHHLQRAEAAFVIHTVCERLRIEHPEIPILTIHDAVMTTTPYITVVNNIMQQEFAKLQLHPTLVVE